MDKGKRWIPKEHTTASGHPTSAMFSDGNGGEYRKTLHMAPPGYVMVTAQNLIYKKKLAQKKSQKTFNARVDSLQPFMCAEICIYMYMCVCVCLYVCACVCV